MKSERKEGSSKEGYKHREAQLLSSTLFPQQKNIHTHKDDKKWMTEDMRSCWVLLCVIEPNYESGIQTLEENETKKNR